MTERKLFVVFHGRFPGEKASSLFAGKSAEAFAGAGVETTLVVPRRILRSRTDPYAYYNLEKNFNIIYLPTLDLFAVPLLRTAAFEISLLTFSIFTFLFLFFKAQRGDIIYSNESVVIFLSSFYFTHTLYELHDFPEQKFFFYKSLFRRTRYLLITNRWKMDKLESLFGVSKEKIILERNAVKIEDFDIPVTKEKAREKLGLPTGKKIVVYTGHLYSWKGADTLAEAAKILSEVFVVFVGGTDLDLRRFKDMYGTVENIFIAGHRSHSEIPYWQKAADVLVLPNTAKENISKFYTSPMKLFEYMASGTPIVASRVPSITEILNNKNAILVEPDNPKVLALGIKKVLDSDGTQGFAERARGDVKEYSWQKRAGRIINFIGSNRLSF